MSGLDFGYVADLPAEHDDGSLISGRISRVVEAIREYDSNLDVQWIKPGERQPGDAAFRVIHKNPDGTFYTVFLVQEESEFDERVLQRLMANDQAQRGGTTYSEVQLAEMAKADIERRRNEDAWAEAEDMAKSLIKSPFHKYQIGKGKFING